MKKIAIAALTVLLVLLTTVSVFAADIGDGSSKGVGSYDIGISGTYTGGSSGAATVSADIEWGTMSFTYTEASPGTWIPDEHRYEGGSVAAWSDTKVPITVTNHSNCAIRAGLTFTAASSVSVTGTFYSKAAGTEQYTALEASAQHVDLATAVGTAYDSAPQGTVYFGVSGDPITGNTTLGTVTVSIAQQ